MSECGHVVIFEGLCAGCGIEMKKSVEYDDQGNLFKNNLSSAGFASRNLGIAVTTDFVSKVETEKFKTLVDERKIILVADLDHTLLHATVDVSDESYLNPTLMGGVWGIGASHVANQIHKDPNKSVDLPYYGGYESKCYVHQYSREGGGTLKRRRLGSQQNDDNLEELLLSKEMSIDPKICGTEDRTTRYPHYAIGKTKKEVEEINEKMLAWEMNSHLIIHDDPLSLSHNQSPDKDMMYRCYIKLRPGVLRFLRDIVETCELYIYTAGTTNHSTGTRLLLDPLNLYFGSNVFTRDHMPNEAKDLRYIFPTLHQMVCVIDDSDYGVWNVNDTGLIRVWAYNYWPTDEHVSKSNEIPTLANSRVLARFRATQSALLNALAAATNKVTDATNYDPFNDVMGEDNYRADNKSPDLYDDDFQLGTVARAIAVIHEEFYEKVDQLTMLLDMNEISISDLPSIHQIIKDYIYEPLSKNTFIAPIYSETNDSKGSSHVRSVCYDYWLLFSNYYNGGLLYRVLGLAVANEDDGFKWVGELKNEHLTSWYKFPNVAEHKREEDFPVLEQYDEWKGYGCVKYIPKLNKYARAETSTIDDRVYVAVGYTIQQAKSKLSETEYNYLSQCVPVEIEWLESRLFALEPININKYRGNYSDRRHFWSYFFNIPTAEINI